MQSIVDNRRTDKNTWHSYLELYEKLFAEKKNTAKNILEIGIGYGGSIKLWHEYFTNATIYGVDLMDDNPAWNDLKNNEKIKLYTSQDAYDENFVKTTFENIRFDIILDDGPHTIESMVSFIQLYAPLLTEEGILIVEDVQDLSWIMTLIQAVPNDLKSFVTVYDRRALKERYDDIVFCIHKKPVNVVIVSSIINCDEKISVFTSKERERQTIEGIKSIRKKIPNSYIILSEVDVHEDVSNIVEKTVIYLDKTFLSSDTKQIGDFLLFQSGLNNLPNNLKIKNVFKISGRYWLNETFSYADYDDDEISFRMTDSNIWKNTVTTCFFKIAYSKLEIFQTFMNSILEYFKFLVKKPPVTTVTRLAVDPAIFGADKIPVITKTESAISIENVFFMFTVLVDVKHMHSLGVSGFIATNGIKGSV